MSERKEICDIIHPIEVRLMVSHPFRKVLEKDGALGVFHTHSSGTIRVPIMMDISALLSAVKSWLPQGTPAASIALTPIRYDRVSDEPKEQLMPSPW